MLIDELGQMIPLVKPSKPCVKRKTEDVLKAVMNRAKRLGRFRAREIDDISNNRTADLKTLMEQGKLIRNGWYYEVTGD